MEKIGFEKLLINPFDLIGRKNFLLSFGNIDSLDIIASSCGGLGFLWNKPIAFIFVRKPFKSETFSLSFFPDEYRNVFDLENGNNKVLTPIALEDTIAFEESDLVLYCKKLSKAVLDKEMLLDPNVLSHYAQDDSHYMYIGEIKGVYIN